MPQPIRKKWGEFKEQTVHRHPVENAVYLIRQGRERIEVGPDELDSLITAILAVRQRTTGGKG